MISPKFISNFFGQFLRGPTTRSLEDLNDTNHNCKSGWMFPKIVGFPPQFIDFNMVFHYFHHPFWGFSPYFWKHLVIPSGVWSSKVAVWELLLILFFQQGGKTQHWHWWLDTLGIQSPCQMMIRVANHLLSIVFRFHYDYQKVIGSLGIMIEGNLAKSEYDFTKLVVSFLNRGDFS